MAKSEPQAKKKKPGRIVAGPVRLSYVYFAKPDYDEDKETSFYRSMILVPKDDKDTLAQIKAAIAAAAKAKFGNKAEKVMKTGNNPLRDPKKEGKDEKVYKGMLFFNAKSNEQPGMLLKNGTKLIDPEDINDEIYPGVWVHASVTFYGFDTNGNKGVACAINNVIKFKDDDRLDGRVEAADEMAELISDDEPKKSKKDKKKGKKGKKKDKI